MIWIELAILLACIVIGARLGGLALGPVAGMGLVIFVFVFGLPPGSPPGVVLGMIVAVVTALAAMEAAGGLEYLVMVAERVLRKRPQYITVIAPLVTLPTDLRVRHAARDLRAAPRDRGSIAQRWDSAGTPAVDQRHRGATRPHRVADLRRDGSSRRGARRPRHRASVHHAHHRAVDARGGADRGAVGHVERRGAERRRRVPGTPRERQGAGAAGSARADAGGDRAGARLDAVVLAGIAFIVLLGVVPGLRPTYSIVAAGTANTAQVDPAAAIMIVMLAIGGLIILRYQASPEAMMKGSIMRGGLAAVISILGISWLGSSFFAANQAQIVGDISGLIQRAAWVFAIGLFFLSSLLFSQAATVVTLMPVGLGLGLSAASLVAMYPAVNGAFFLPTYGTVLAAVAFDQTGTTRIGKYLLNHSFMLPGLVTTVSATLIALLLSRIIGP